jgi:type VI secretion system FHA domain protein
MRPEEIVEYMQVAGTLIREITGGLMTMLRGRMEIKNQFRVSRTILRPTGNNPLKFSLTPEDALKLLLVEKKPGFLEAVEAVRQACTDIMNHELASTAANQASLLAILKQFDPHNFSHQYEEGFILQKKSKCWETYCQAYPELIKNAQENFFGEEFANAYEEQMNKLRSMNRTNQQKLRDKDDE